MPEGFSPTQPFRQFSAVWPVVIAGGLHLECVVDAVPDFDTERKIHGGQSTPRAVQNFGEVSFRHVGAEEAAAAHN